MTDTQLDEQKKNCIFCKIISGDIQGKKLYEDNYMSAILDINPVTPGHTLLLPREHYPILPLLPPETFRHMFTMLPKLCNALKNAMLTTGINVMIANGAVAGQQSPHFLMHLIPREIGDSFDKFLFAGVEIENSKKSNNILSQNLNAMMQGHMQKNPETKTDEQQRTPVNIKRSGTTIYEDEKAICIAPEKQVCNGHLVIYSKEEEHYFDQEKNSTHLFYLASFAATAVFESLGAHGTNIILKSGESNDNMDSGLSIHIIPRYAEDSLDLKLEPMKEKPNLDDVQAKIRDKTFILEHACDEEEKCEVINLDTKPKIIQPDKATSRNRVQQEIINAINNLKQ